ncbi:MAG: AAA family ATPase [Bacteroidetes bacterium]|nr:AAA family ATPase [Bacteroidota bacterium]
MKILHKIKRFKIVGLHYYQDFDIAFDEDIKILVGENGLGKTTILKTLYYVLTQKWFALSKNVGFDFLELHIGSDIIDFSHAELESFLLTTVYKYNDYNNEEILLKFNNIINVLDPYKGYVVYFPYYRNIEEDIDKSGLPFKVDWSNYSDKELNEAIAIQRDTVFSNDMKDVYDRIESNANPITRLKKFQAACNKYLVATKLIFTKEQKLVIQNIKSRDIVEQHQLSTGEKQILFIFSKIFLTQKSNLIVLFDEPELSLSLNWQRELLSDVLSLHNCSFLFVVTHSPFIFDNRLDRYAVGMDTLINKNYE